MGMMSTATVGTIKIGAGEPLAVIGGPCVIESYELMLRVGRVFRDACRSAGVNYIVKGSFDKANRSSIHSSRGPGIDRGLEWLRAVADELGVPCTTDIHEPGQADQVASRVDLIQIPAFLCRQTDLLVAAGRSASERGRAVNIKKGQFMAPVEMKGAVKKVGEAGCGNVMLTERGTFFGYHRLVNDFCGVGEMMSWGVPVCFDCTHSTQFPGAEGDRTGGQPQHAPLLARAATAAGVHALFMEAHPEPAKAMSDASTQLVLDSIPGLIARVAAIRAACV